MRLLMVIGLGGFLGTLARYLTQQGINKLFPVIFPYGTLTVNVLGSFVIGIVYAYADRTNVLTDEWRYFLIAGFCGGFTTFSSLSLESFTLIRDGHYATVVAYLFASLVVGLGATFGGVALVRSLA